MEALGILKKLVSIQSVSTDKKRKDELLKAADYIKKELLNIGLSVDLYEKDGSPPLILARKNVSDEAPTIGIYAHYDVQPEDPVGKWGSPPFELTRIGSKLFGRGVADDKMHLVQAVVALKNLIDSNKLRNNIVFVFEGEEEMGSEHFEELVKKADETLKSIDVFYVLDVGMKAKDAPQIYYGLRGFVGFELKVKIGESDLHSGVFGNRVLNPAQVVADLFSKMKSPKGEILIPGFYDKVRNIPKKEIEGLSKRVMDIEEERKNAKVIKMAGGFLESKIKPSLDINGIYSGYTGQGFKTIIPSEANVKFSLRLVENQKAQEVVKMVKEFVDDNMPTGVEYELVTVESSDPFYTDYKNPYAEKTAAILEDVFSGECLFNRSGGSIAAAEVLQRLYGKPIILTGFTLPDENLHAPNENVEFEMFEKGIVALQRIFSVAP